MILNLRQFEAFPAHLSLKADPESLAIAYDSVVGVSAAEMELDIQKAGDEFFCQGRANATVRLTCARCLEEFEHRLTSVSDFIVCSREWLESHKDVKDNEDHICFEGSELSVDLTDMMRQAVIVEISMKPLCSDDCRGLCPGCGANLNTTTCTCKKTQTDPRWDALKKLSQQ